MNNPQAPGIVGVLGQWGFAPNGNCYCGCPTDPGPVNGYFLPGHDTRFLRNMLNSPHLRGDQGVYGGIQAIAGANPQVNQQALTLADTLRFVWGFQPTGFCYCGCGNATPAGGYFLTDHHYPFGVGLLNALAGNQQVLQAIRQLAQIAPQAPDELNEAADLNLIALALQEVGGALRESADALERAANRLAPDAE